LKKWCPLAKTANCKWVIALFAMHNW
jgi:hypothetical protein